MRDDAHDGRRCRRHHETMMDDDEDDHEIMDDDDGNDKDAAAATTNATDDGSWGDRDAIAPDPTSCVDELPTTKRPRRHPPTRRRTAAERLARWMDDSDCRFRLPQHEIEQERQLPLPTRHGIAEPPSSLESGQNDQEGERSRRVFHRPVVVDHGRRRASAEVTASLPLPVLLACREAGLGGRGRCARLPCGIVEWQRQVVARPKKKVSTRNKNRRSTPTSAMTTSKDGSGERMLTERLGPVQALSTGTKKAQLAPPPPLPPIRHEFRPWHRRSIPFTKLGTPRTEAVLGLDHTGSYVITLGDLDVPANEDVGGPSSVACLALRMYGVPSPAALRRSRNRSGAHSTRTIMATPLLMTAPLHLAPHSEFHSLTARTPTLLCLSSDGEIGVAVVRDPVPLFHRMESLDSQPVVALIVFPLPRHRSMTMPTPPHSTCSCMETLRLQDPKLSVSDREADVRKVMWKVHRLPRERISGIGCGVGERLDVDDAQGYLLLLRQENRACYRLTWIQSGSFCQAPGVTVLRDGPTREVHRPPQDGSGHVGAILSRVVDSEGCGWKLYCTDRSTGIELPCTANGGDRFRTLNRDGDDAIRVVGEKWLRLDTILADVVRRRPKFARPPASTTGGSDSGNISLPDTRIPLFSCDVVQVSDGGETLQAVLCFMPCPRKRFMYAVFVEVDLLAPEPSYRELKWLKRAPVADRVALSVRSNPSMVDDEARLTQLAETLSLNERMSLERIGPYSLAPEPLRDWSAMCTVGTTEPDEWTVRDPDPRRWTLSSSTGGDGDGTAPDTIPYDAIFPDCQVLNNRAVLRQTPVMSLVSRSSATEIVYG